MATYNNQLIVLEAGRLQKISSADNIGISGSVTIGGNLTVTGTITSGSTVNATSQDQFIDLAIGQSTTTAKPGGFTVTSQRTSGTSTFPTVSFTAGVVATSAPVIVVAGNAAASIPADAILEIYGATASINNGLYLVKTSVYDGTTNTTLTLYGVGGTAVPGDMLFCQSQVATATDSGATAFNPYLVVMCAADGITVKTSAPAVIAQGQFAYASGSDVGDFFQNWVQVTQGAAAVSLQDAYNNGNAIDMTAADGAFDVEPASGQTVGFSIDGSAASNVSVTGNNLTLSTLTSGTLALDSVGLLTVDADLALSLNSSGGAINIGDGANAFAINVGTGAAARLITIGNQTTTTEVQIDTGTNGFDVNSLGVASISSVGNSEFTVGSGNLSLATTTSGSVLIDGLSGVEINSDTGTILIGNDADTGNIEIGNSASARTINIGNTNTTTSVNINTGSGGLDVSAAGASTISVTSGALSLNASSGAINIGDAANAQNINIGTGAAARVITIGNLTGATGLDLKAGTGDIALSTASTGTITATAVQADVTLTTTTSGDVTLSPANDVNLTPGAGFNTRIDTDALFTAAGGIEIDLIAGAVKGNIVYINSSGIAVLAQNDVLGDALVDGVALEANAGATAVKRVGTVYGTKVFVKFAGTAPSVGDIAYLSATAGEATATLPTSGRIFQIGRVIGGVSSSLYPVLFHPQYIADN